MPHLRAVQDKPVRIVAGLMCGTSMDGLDMAICRIDRDRPSCELLAFETVPLPDELMASLRGDETGSLAAVAHWHRAIGEAYAQALAGFVRREGIALDLIGSHGQTVYHAHGEASLQLGDPCFLADALDCPVVSQFRQGDIALGGAGAPLVPYVDYRLVGRADRATMILNIGGIANFTVLPRRPCPPEAVMGFDCGPGNMIIDHIARRYTEGRQGADLDGRFASRGSVRRDVFDHLREHRFFGQRPPRSAGREQFGPAFADALIEAVAPVTDQDWLDLFATATELTAFAVYDAYRRFVAPSISVEEILLCGGGAHNGELARRIGRYFSNLPVAPTDSVGWPADAKEAMAFAFLASERVDERPANMPSVTGARRAVLLGSITAC
ncbi:anhydro-N-acetylmuramic acid kinase [Marinivivus vitaminiproducens]|uniref:anhydro-N-acetylmuramic acid kinase n=1 Tax=Marinivivus vitaminiproducens TaxID=3035935 RepID=UPI0027A273E1|nr:anhydro-N-acetylmuramic acid kinase [Geminicoccaceae bacterium SCSIO 64248]